jgi:6-phosphogluconolactonase
LKDLSPVFAVTDSPKPPPRRLTLGLGVLSRARAHLVLARGAAKGPVAARARRGPDPALPVSLLPAPVTSWYLDDAAAAAARQA